MVVEKTIEVPKIVIPETIVKLPKIHNTVGPSQVQDQIQTAEVEKPKIIHKIDPQPVTPS